MDPSPRWMTPTYARWALLHHLAIAFVWACAAAIYGALRFTRPLFSAAFLFVGVLLSGPISTIFVWNHQSTLLDFRGATLHYRSYSGVPRIIPDLTQRQVLLRQSWLEKRFDVGRIIINEHHVTFYGVSQFAATRTYLLAHLPSGTEKEPAAAQQTPDRTFHW